MNYIKINGYVVTNDNDLELLYKFDKFPIYMECVDDDNFDLDIRLDLQFFISKNSAL
jgi:hypothetical protein